jgi:uncharacterized membrane protein
MRQILKYSRLNRTPKKELREHGYNNSDRQYWINPAWMIGSFLAGLALAVAHHVHYTKLDGTLVGSAARQQWPIRHVNQHKTLNLSTYCLRFGTAFAFFFKACLANAIGIAYIQLVWRKCRQQSTAMSTIDAAFSADRNVSVLLRVDYIRRFPIASGLIAILWYVSHYF